MSDPKEKGKLYHEATRAILASQLPMPSKIVLLSLVDRHGENGLICPSLTRISKDTNLSRPAVVAALAKLETAGVIVIERAERAGPKKHNQYSFATSKRALPVNELYWLTALTLIVNAADCNDKLTANTEKPAASRKARVFVKPSPAEVTAYAKDIGFDLDGQYFVDSNEAKGWVVGKNRTPMKDWQAAVRTWRHNETRRQMGGDKVKQKADAQNDHQVRTCDVLAHELGVGSATVERDGRFAKAVETLPEVKEKIQKGERVVKQDVIAAAKAKQDGDDDTAKRILDGKATETDAEYYKRCDEAAAALCRPWTQAELRERMGAAS